MYISFNNTAIFNKLHSFHSFSQRSDGGTRVLLDLSRVTLTGSSMSISCGGGWGVTFAAGGTESTCITCTSLEVEDFVVSRRGTVGVVFCSFKAVGAVLASCKGPASSVVSSCCSLVDASEAGGEDCPSCGCVVTADLRVDGTPDFCNVKNCELLIVVVWDCIETL